MRILFALLLGSFFLSPTLVVAAVQAQAAKSEQSKADLAVGLNVGEVVGNGLIVRLYSGQAFSQVTYGGYIDRVADDAYFNVSLSYARYLKKISTSANTSSVGLKWLVGGGVIYDNYQGVSANKINAGSGFGIDFGAIDGSGLVFSLNAIYALGFDGLRQPTFASLRFEPSAGILYNFHK